MSYQSSGKVSEGKKKKTKLYKWWQNWKYYEKDETMWKNTRERENKDNKPTNNEMEIYE